MKKKNNPPKKPKPELSHSFSWNVLETSPSFLANLGISGGRRGWMCASPPWHNLSPKGSAGELIILCNNFGALSSPSLSVKPAAFEEF